MNREKIVEAILKHYRQHDSVAQGTILIQSLKRIVSDATLICFARDLGIDTDAVLNAGQSEVTPS